MDNVVRTWEDGVNPVGEIELTDTELEAIYGAFEQKQEEFNFGTRLVIFGTTIDTDTIIGTLGRTLG